MGLAGILAASCSSRATERGAVAAPLDCGARAAADYAALVSRDEAAAHAGVPVAAEGLWFPRGGWIQPASLAEAQLFACGERLERRFKTE